MSQVKHNNNNHNELNALAQEKPNGVAGAETFAEIQPCSTPRRKFHSLKPWLGSILKFQKKAPLPGCSPMRWH